MQVIGYIVTCYTIIGILMVLNMALIVRWNVHKQRISRTEGSLKKHLLGFVIIVAVWPVVPYCIVKQFRTYRKNKRLNRRHLRSAA